MNLTREQIINEPAGSRLDAWVAEHVFGVVPRIIRVQGSTEYVACQTDNPFFQDGSADKPMLIAHAQPREYSTDIAAAWSVVEKIRTGIQPRMVTLVQYHGTGCGGYCMIESCRSGEVLGKDRYTVSGDTMPLAICRAALVATLPPTPKPTLAKATATTHARDIGD
jgi:hypothetical protein